MEEGCAAYYPGWMGMACWRWCWPRGSLCRCQQHEACTLAGVDGHIHICAYEYIHKFI